MCFFTSDKPLGVVAVRGAVLVRCQKNGSETVGSLECRVCAFAKETKGEKIRVGRDFQAVVPELIPVADRRLEQCPDRALLVWSPTTDISDTKCKLI
ncbi:hypothetical protein LSTR_LSTR017677 [Laodelphax striatellus]|uniref:ELM2 domain-containing protein n=1 Tax=Laodelphax striatellus TaxID=195883 RepID=A0A482WXX8_LAOST|nr:hypothetical protein LSTR_LSTR017677 [Laodelphax striatellus]